jgi:pyruvate dehydrogenase E2 component (dihydrolipoyllysine-residue acetyltransferase)
MMMSDKNIIALTMPKWGMSMATGKVIEWLKEEGAVIEKDDEILEVETEKIVNAMEANDTGILFRQVAKADDEIPVGALLGVITQDGVDSDAVDAFITKFQEEFVPEEICEEIDNTPKMVTTGEMTIAYREFPARDDQSKLPILFIHGFGGDQNSWLFNTAELSEHQDVYTLDLPGHGASSKQVGRGTLVELAQSVTETMDSINVQKVHLIGHSLGAAIAVQIVNQSADRVASLTLLAGAGSGTVVDNQYIEGFIAANRRKDMKPYLQKLFANPELVNRDMIENVLKAKRIEGAELCLNTIAHASIFEKTKIVPAENLKKIDKPIQIIWGTKDNIALVSQANDLTDDFEVHLIEDAGHMIHMEAASKVNELISTFISNT